MIWEFTLSLRLDLVWVNSFSNYLTQLDSSYIYKILFYYLDFIFIIV